MTETYSKVTVAINLLIIWVATAIGLLKLREIDIAAKLECWTYAPNRYRLFHQLLIFLHDNPFSIVTLISLSFGVCVTISYFIIRPEGNDLSLFLLGVVLVGCFGYGLNAVMYPILALLSRYHKSPGAIFLLIPLALVKEFAFFVAVVFLFLVSRTRYLKLRALIVGALGVVCYLILRCMILGDVGNSPVSAPLFTLFYMIQGVDIWLLGVGCCAVLMICLASRTRHDWYLTIVTALVVSIFALWWEPQLWLPTLILILAEPRRRTEEP